MACGIFIFPAVFFQQCLPPPKKREKLYIPHCAKFTFCRNYDNTIGYFEFADLSYFNLGMFNFVQVMWNFCKISGEIFAKFRVKFWRNCHVKVLSKRFKLSCQSFSKLSCEIWRKFVAATLPIGRFTLFYTYSGPTSLAFISLLM